MTRILLSLPPSDLRAVASALRSERLSAPFTEQSLGRFLGNVDNVGVAAALTKMLDSGMNPTALATSIELVASALESRPELDDVLELVTTSPDAYMANRDTGVVVREMFGRATKSVLVAGYAVYQGKKIFEVLAERMNEFPHLDVQMFLDIQRRAGDTTMTGELVNRFLHRFKNDEWPNGARLPRIYYDPRGLFQDPAQRAALHAKCVVIDDTEVFISSANFTEAAQQRNIEVGLRVRSGLLGSRVISFFNGLVAASAFRQIY